MILRPIEHHEIPGGQDPTGEGLLDRALPPWRLWTPERDILVIGHSQAAERELVAEAVTAAGIPVYKRRSGGGAVLLGPGCLCLALRFKRTPSLGIHDCFDMGLGVVAAAVKAELGLELARKGISDLAAGDRKAVGCSLYMPRDYALFLASLLVDADHAGMARYLAHPSKEPGYRGGRDHGDFVAGLSELAGRKVEAGPLISRMENEIRSLEDRLDFAPTAGGQAQGG